MPSLETEESALEMVIEGETGESPCVRLVQAHI